MSEGALSLLCVASGLGVMVSGLVITRSRVKQARRIRRKASSIHAAMPEGWGSWFFQGLSDVTTGAGLVASVGVLAFWMVFGVALVSLGVHLAR